MALEIVHIVGDCEASARLEARFRNGPTQAFYATWEPDDVLLEVESEVEGPIHQTYASLSPSDQRLVLMAIVSFLEGDVVVNGDVADLNLEEIQEVGEIWRDAEGAPVAIRAGLRSRGVAEVYRGVMGSDFPLLEPEGEEGALEARTWEKRGP